MHFSSFAAGDNQADFRITLLGERGNSWRKMLVLEPNWSFFTRIDFGDDYWWLALPLLTSIRSAVIHTNWKYI